jgi:hypothetical protein
VECVEGFLELSLGNLSENRVRRNQTAEEVYVHIDMKINNDEKCSYGLGPKSEETKMNLSRGLN